MRYWMLVMLVAVCAPAFAQTPLPPAAENGSIRSRLQRVVDESTCIEKSARNIDARLTTMREEFSSFGLNDGNRLMLEETRRALPSTSLSQQQIAWVHQESRWLKLQILEHEQEIGSELYDAVNKDADHGLQPGESAALHEMHDYGIALGKLASAHQVLVDSVHTMQTFLDRQLLWVANAHPVSLSDFQKATGCAARLGNPKPWLELGRRFATRINNDPWQLGLVVVLVIAVGVTAHRLGGDQDPGDRKKSNENRPSQPDSPDRS